MTDQDQNNDGQEPIILSEQTSKDVASKAAKLLRDKDTPANVKSVAGSGLSQRNAPKAPPKTKKGKK